MMPLAVTAVMKDKRLGEFLLKALVVTRNLFHISVKLLTLEIGERAISRSQIEAYRSVPCSREI